MSYYYLLLLFYCFLVDTVTIVFATKDEYEYDDLSISFVFPVAT